MSNQSLQSKELSIKLFKKRLLTNDSYAALLQTDIFCLLRDLHVRSARLLDLLDVVAGLADDHAGGRVRHQYLDLLVPLLHHLVVSLDQRFAQVRFLPYFVHNKVHHSHYGFYTTRYEAHTFRRPWKNKNESKVSGEIWVGWFGAEYNQLFVVERVKVWKLTLG